MYFLFKMGFPIAMFVYRRVLQHQTLGNPHESYAKLQGFGRGDVAPECYCSVSPESLGDSGWACRVWESSTLALFVDVFCLVLVEPEHSDVYISTLIIAQKKSFWRVSKLLVEMSRLIFMKNHHCTPLKFNISPEKWWLEDVFPIEIVPFLGTC